MPGRIGALYSELGGRVEYIGKPYPAVYEKCAESFSRFLARGEALDKTRMCGVGDSLDHDVLGANRFGIASVFTANGVHCGELGTIEGSKLPPDSEALQSLLLKFDPYAHPNFIIPNFSW
jgi:ribonucleotide monophosphatase NagD (HAD superfamily)